MTKETTYCDRCGQELKGYWNNFGFHLYHRKYIIANVHNDDEYLDLCKDCYKTLSEWFKKGLNSDEQNI